LGAASGVLLTELRVTASRRSRPLSVLCELTHACNVDCEHCYLDLAPDRVIGAMTTDEWKRVFDELAAAGCLFLTLSGGELLVRRDWFELATHARSLSFALRLYSNATLIDDANADRIASLSVIGVDVSLLGGTAATHDAIARKPRAFERTLAGVKRLRDRGVPVLFKTVVMESNAHEVSEVRQLAASLGCDAYFDLEVTPKNNGSRAPVALRTAVATVRQVLADPEMAAALHTEPVRVSPAVLAGSPCGAGRTGCQIGPTGDVFPCVQWTKPVGNVRASSFASVWYGSADLARVRSQRVGDMTVCTGCALFETCSPCMALSLLENGNLDGPSPTKCHATWVRAQARGIEGRPAGLPADVTLASLVQPSGALVQLGTRGDRTVGSKGAAQSVASGTNRSR
jgi:radical SAM protein with 4Fe4S-binding SPASM domain